MRILLFAASALAFATPGVAETYDLKPTPQTVAWGHYDATDKPVLTIKSGDTVVIHTLLTNSPAGLEKAGVSPGDVEPSLRAVFDGVAASARGPGGHILTGPIASIYTYTRKQVILSGKGTCPDCGKPFRVARLDYRFPQPDLCESCQSSVKLELPG